MGGGVAGGEGGWGGLFQYVMYLLVVERKCFGAKVNNSTPLFINTQLLQIFSSSILLIFM